MVRIDGRIVRFDLRWSEPTDPTLMQAYAELIALTPDVILANASTALAPLLQVTRTVPGCNATVIITPCRDCRKVRFVTQQLSTTYVPCYRQSAKSREHGMNRREVIVLPSCAPNGAST